MKQRVISTVALLIVATATYAAKETSQSLGMVGIAQGQTVRLNVVLIPPPQGEPVCTDNCPSVRLQFIDAAGNVLTESRAVLVPGRAEALEWSIVGRDIARVQIRGNVIFLDDPPGCRVVLSLEVYDKETGRTQFALHSPGPCK